MPKAPIPRISTASQSPFSKDFQGCPRMSKDFQGCPRISKIFQACPRSLFPAFPRCPKARFPMISKDFQGCPRISRNVQSPFSKDFRGVPCLQSQSLDCFKTSAGLPHPFCSHPAGCVVNKSSSTVVPWLSRGRRGVPFVGHAWLQSSPKECCTK